MLNNARHIARWDLDKTYLRTEFATMRDIVRTALERPDEKRTHPGATTLLRRMIDAGSEIHILSGSPEQLRSKLEEKLKLDGIAWTSFTLKPNLRNMLRLRFRAVRDQLGYKLPMLLAARANMQHTLKLAKAKQPTPPASPGQTEPIEAELAHETLLGDDAEADAFVYALYSDVVAGNVDATLLQAILECGNVYPDVAAKALADAARIKPGIAVERILIHLEGQSPPSDFASYGTLVVPFYNYLQAAFVLWEDGRLEAAAVLDVARELVLEHRFDGEQLARSYRDLRKRGHAGRAAVGELTQAAIQIAEPWGHEANAMCEAILGYQNEAVAEPKVDLQNVHPTPNYLELVQRHNLRRRAKH
jgi:hypothetical protein